MRASRPASKAWIRLASERGPGQATRRPSPLTPAPELHIMSKIDATGTASLRSPGLGNDFEARDTQHNAHELGQLSTPTAAQVMPSTAGKASAGSLIAKKAWPFLFGQDRPRFPRPLYGTQSDRQRSAALHSV
jgi:hypothetical protein